MLKEITLTSFKSYKTARLPLAPLTVLIGANASGKSNAIEAVRLLSWLAQGQRLSAIQHTVNQSDRIVRGTIDNLLNDAGKPFGFGVIVEAEPNALLLGLQLKIERRLDGLHIADENVEQVVDDTLVYAMKRASTGRGTDVEIEYNNEKPGRNPQIICSDQSAIFTQLLSPASFNQHDDKARESIPAAARALAQALDNVLFLYAVPARMRDYAFPSDRELQGDGSNVSAVLFNLLHGQIANDPLGIRDAPQMQSRVDTRTDVLEFIRSLPEQNVTDVEFLREPRGGVLVALVESFGEKQQSFDASLLSDGTLRVLSVAAALLSAPTGTLVVIEEIDNGVHPNRARQLLSSIDRIARQRGLRILLSTHNPALLDALPDAALPDVVFCYRSPTDGSSRLLRLQDAPNYPGLIAQDTLGGLVTSGALDRWVKNPADTQERQRAAEQWIARMRAGPAS